MNEEPKQPYSLDAARADIRALNEERIALLNRCLANEALAFTLIAELPLPVLQEMKERFDLRILNAMQHLPPTHQREHIWNQYADKIQEVIGLRQRQQPGTPP